MADGNSETPGSGRPQGQLRGRPGLRYTFADLTLDAGLRRVSRADETLRLGKLTYQMLQVLVESAPNVVSQDRLAETVWAGRLVSSETITQRVKLLRDALSDRASDPRYIGLVRGHGYRLLHDVETLPAGFAKDRLLAVLPFESFSNDSRDYFAAGLHEETLTQLAAFRGLRVLARTSVKQYEGTQRSIPEIAGELGVGTVMEGSVRYFGGRVRVTAQLIDGVSGAHLWAQVYERQLEDNFDAQTEIAARIASGLRSEIYRKSSPMCQAADTNPPG